MANYPRKAITPPHHHTITPSHHHTTTPRAHDPERLADNPTKCDNSISPQNAITPYPHKMRWLYIPHKMRWLYIPLKEKGWGPLRPHP